MSRFLSCDFALFSPSLPRSSAGHAASDGATALSTLLRGGARGPKAGGGVMFGGRRGAVVEEFTSSSSAGTEERHITLENLCCAIRGGYNRVPRRTEGGYSLPSSSPLRKPKMLVSPESSGFAKGEEGAASVSLRGGGSAGESSPSPGTNAAGDENTMSPTLCNNAFLEFVAPGKVEVRHEKLVVDDQALGQGQILVEAICSSVSSGTELKVRAGSMDSEEGKEVGYTGGPFTIAFSASRTISEYIRISVNRPSYGCS